MPNLDQRRRWLQPRKPRAKFGNLFIVTYGRSGSTLLQGLLNTIPGYVIRGENAGIAGILLDAYRRLPQRSFGPRASLPTHPWFGEEYLNSPNYIRGMRSLFDQILLADQPADKVRCFGFKEIRFNISTIDDELRFLKAVFPEACFIFNTRNIDQVMLSQKAVQESVGFREVKSRNDIEHLDKYFSDHEKNNSFSFKIDYDDVRHLREPFRRLFAFLEERFDSEVLKECLAIPHSYK